MRVTPAREIKMFCVSRQVQNLHRARNNTRVMGEHRFRVALVKVVNYTFRRILSKNRKIETARSEIKTTKSGYRKKKKYFFLITYKTNRFKDTKVIHDFQHDVSHLERLAELWLRATRRRDDRVGVDLYRRGIFRKLHSEK
ncbi:hypothetical protein PUN28_004609 [Cardiocondyla obscurior]|uniref:Ribosomal protein L20 n=1 Tax=Cardiocondyla obscurior TaxID=286306 RepID=A0AAW2GEA6_9HYME